MTLHDIEVAVAAIAVRQKDNAGAHAAEDELRAEFIRYIAQHGPLSLAAKAKAVLKTDDLHFFRWYE